MVVTLDGKDAGRRPAGALDTVGVFHAARLAAVRGLLFELGGVLYDDTLWHRWLVNLLRRLGVDVTFRTFSALWRQAYRGDVHSGRRDYDECLGEFLYAVGLSCGQVDEILIVSASRRRDLAAPCRLLPGVAKTLAQLRTSGIALGVLTDDTEGGDALEDQLAGLGLGDCFDAAVCSREVGCTKPDPRCYEYALHRLGVPAEHVAFVGNDARDLQGAAGAGLATVAVNGDEETHANAEAQVAGFDGLLRFFGSPARALAG